jgi:hypothetical protein
VKRQLSDVYQIMQDHGWRTLRELATRHGNLPEASASARLRELRRVGYIVERRPARLPAGVKAKVYEYRVR